VLGRRRGAVPARRRLAANVALALTGLLLPLAAAEGFFLLWVDTTDGALATLTSRRWAGRHLPQPLRWDTFRGRLLPSLEAINRPATVFVAAVGDSITYGQGIKRDRDLYPAVLERELRAAGIAADVFNISRVGWNTTKELAELHRHFDGGQSFDVVVLGFCLNDIGDVVTAPPEFSAALGRLRTPPALLAPLVERSFVASFLYARAVSLTSPVLARTWDTIAAAYRQPETFGRLAAQLEQIKGLVDAHGAALIVLTFPDTSGPWERYPYRDVHAQLAQFWGRLGATHVDLLPLFERRRPEELQVGLLDSHPNELAHRLAAGAAADALLGLLGRARPTMAKAPGAP
jgi:lysophospholipase L1-like esterase